MNEHFENKKQNLVLENSRIHYEESSDLLKVKNRWAKNKYTQYLGPQILRKRMFFSMHHVHMITMLEPENVCA